jgi:hypothetical protein
LKHSLLTFSILFVMLAVSFLLSFEAYEPIPLTKAVGSPCKDGSRGRGLFTGFARGVRASHAVVVAHSLGYGSSGKQR